MAPSIDPKPRLTPANLLAFAIGIAFVVVGVLAITAPWVIRSRDLGVDANGASAMGSIEAVSPALSAGGDGEFTISYSFVTADGSEQHATRTVTEAYWRAAFVGQAVDVRYDPGRPASNHPAGFGQTSIGLAIFVSVIGALIGGLGLVVVVGMVRWRPAASG